MTGAAVAHVPPHCVATIGVFDGVHRGHHSLIAATDAEARRLATAERPVEPVLFTFDPHPAVVLAPGRVTTLLTPVAEKLELIRERGVSNIRVLQFDRTMAALTPEEFIDGIVNPAGRLLHLVIGHDFALGRDRVGDAPRLARIGVERGFEVSRLPAVRVAGEVVSSTRIREALRDGDVERATAFLGRPYELRGTVVTGDGRGRTIGVPTANVRLPADKFPPALGVYAVRVALPGIGALSPGAAGLILHPAVMNFGRRPTFGGGEATVEVHLLDFSGELVDQVVQVDLMRRIREERKFDGVEALVAQIRADIAEARRILGEGSEGLTGSTW